MRWRLRAYAVAASGVVSAVAALFFGIYGAILVYTALTFTGEGSLGHVGMYVAAFVFPLLFIFFAGATWLALVRYRSLRRRDLAS